MEHKTKKYEVKYKKKKKLTQIFLKIKINFKLDIKKHNKIIFT
jgi:hypothetical protein